MLEFQDVGNNDGAEGMFGSDKHCESECVCHPA